MNIKNILLLFLIGSTLTSYGTKTKTEISKPDNTLVFKNLRFMCHETMRNKNVHTALHVLKNQLVWNTFHCINALNMDTNNNDSYHLQAFCEEPNNKRNAITTTEAWGIITANDNKKLRIINPETQQITVFKNLLLQEYRPTCLTYNTDLNILLGGISSGKFIKKDLRAPENGFEYCNIESSSEPLIKIYSSNDYLFSLSKNSCFINLWDLRQNKPIALPEKSEEIITTFQPKHEKNSSKLLIGTNKGLLAWWDFKENALAEMDYTNGSIISLDSNENHIFCINDTFKTVEVRDKQKGLFLTYIAIPSVPDELYEVLCHTKNSNFFYENRIFITSSNGICKAY